jgi:hypothetical protein
MKRQNVRLAQPQLSSAPLLHHADFLAREHNALHGFDVSLADTRLQRSLLQRVTRLQLLQVFERLLALGSRRELMLLALLCQDQLDAGRLVLLVEIFGE